MRHATGALLLAFAILGTASGSTTRLQAQGAGTGQPGVVAQRTAAEVRAFRLAPTLADWKRAHPGDTLERYRQVPEVAIVSWCVGSRTTQTDPGYRLDRTSYFAPPPVPSPFRVPAADVPADQLLGQAVPSYFWTEVETGDADRARALAADVRRTLDADGELGRGQADAKISAFGSAFWGGQVLWTRPGISVAVAVAPPRGGPLRDVPATRVIVVASLAASCDPIIWHTDRPSSPADLCFEQALEEETDARLRKRVEEAIEIAAPGGSVEADVRALLPYVTRDVFFDARPPGDPDRLIAVLQAWLKAAAELDAPRRAAAWLVADQILQGTFVPFGLAAADGPSAESAARLRGVLKSMGAGFVHLELGGTYFYTNTWLRQAHALSPGGRPGDLVFLTLMEKGFETSGACADQGGEGFRAVIEHGTAFLRSGPAKDRTLTTDVSFLMAQASGDIVALASGFGYEGAEEAKKYKPVEARARQEAIDYYRRALQEVARPDARARNGWAELWRLQAGIAPSHTYFYCVYD